MRNEFIPFFRSTVGFDRLLDSLVDRANETVDDYPPYNIAKTGEDAYRVTLAVAGLLLLPLRKSKSLFRRTFSKSPRKLRASPLANSSIAALPTARSPAPSNSRTTFASMARLWRTVSF